MEWIELTIHTTTAGADLVSEALMQEGATGTMVEDRADIPDPTKPNGIWEIIDPKLIEAMPEDVLVHAWFEPDASFADKLQALRLRMTELASSAAMDMGTLDIGTANVHDEDWSEVWKKFYKPFRAGHHLVVKPTWELYDAQPGDKVIEIDPGMAFGSGTHHTTRLCCELLEQLPTAGCRVLDMGTGSGILSIAALLLGAKEAVGVDIDKVAVRTAAENAAQNGFGPDRFTALAADLIHQPLPEETTRSGFDLVLANIVADVIIALAPAIMSHLRSGGCLVASGIILPRREEVIAALESAGLIVTDAREQEGWCALLMKKP